MSKARWKIRVLLVEGHPLMLLGLKTVLEAEESVEVVGEAREISKALDLTVKLKPDLVIIDVEPSEKGDIELCRQIKSSLSHSPYVLIYAAYDYSQLLYSCQLSGADSYVHKSEDVTKLLEALQNFRPRRERERLLGTELEEVEAQVQITEGLCRLTEKEREIFALLVKRRTNPEIAKELYLSPLTVKTHVARILGKLGLKSRRQIL